MAETPRQSQTPEAARDRFANENFRVRQESYTADAAHAINFMFKQYQYGEGGEGVRGFSNFARTSASVSLPLPANLQDSFSVQVGAFEMGSMGALAADALSGASVGDDIGTAFRAAMNASSSGGDGADKSAVSEGVSTAISSLQAASTFFGRNALDELGFGGVAGGVSVAGGNAINPHVALKFDGVDMKSHTFVWNLAPRNARESEDLARIISQFKRAMLPSYGLGGAGAAGRALLNYPDIVEISFSGLDTEYFYKFKKCMIKSFDVNYTQNGPAILQGGRPAAVQMTLAVTEAEIHTREDYS